MSDEESLEQRQENEVVALKAIFGSCLIDAREDDVWDVSRLLSMCLILPLGLVIVLCSTGQYIWWAC